MSILTLLTDFGLEDYYVGAVKGTLFRLTDRQAGAADGKNSPGVSIVDIAHDVPPGDVETAAFLLAAAAPSFPRGTVHLSVVDPGVGSDRRILAARVAGSTFIAPDNGLLSSIVFPGPAQEERWTVERAPEIRSVERPDLFLDSPAATFHGRDRFAPVAAALLRGEDFRALGPEVEDPSRLDLGTPRREATALHGRVAHIDRFGNLVTDIPTGWTEGRFESARLGKVEGRGTGGSNDREIRIFASHYAALPAGEAAILPGSLGTLELCLRNRSLGSDWGVQRGRTLTVRLSKTAG